MTSSTPPFSKPPCSLISSSNHIMPSKSKSSRREHSSETIAIILTLKNLSKSHAQIVDHLKLSKFIVIIIVHRIQRQENSSLRPTKRAGRPHKLNARARRRLIRHVEANSRDDFATLSSLSKVTHSVHRVIVRSYLRVAGYLRFKARKKSFLTSKHKLARLKWAREHVNWTLEDWMHVIWTNEITFETGLNTRSDYVSRRKGTAMKCRYLKFTFKSDRIILSIWETITWEIKGSVHFLQKEGRMNSEIYVNQMLKELSLSFYAKCVNERDYMIYMNDEIDYHIFKLIVKWRHENGLKRMHWSAQSSDLNLIENLWRLIKLRISDRRHRVHSIEEMKRVVEDEWNKLTSKDFQASIESMQRRCQTVIKARGGMTKYWSIKSFNSWFSFRKYVFYLINWRCRDEVIIWMWGDQEIWGVVSEPVSDFLYPIVHILWIYSVFLIVSKVLQQHSGPLKYQFN
jgi:transposase